MSLNGGFQGATKNFHVDKRLTALELTGGYDCYPDMPQRRPDLSVEGGLRVKKIACLEGGLTIIKGDATIEGNLTVLQNSFLANIYAEKITTDAIYVEDFIAGNVTANTATIDTINSHCIVTDKIIANTATFVDTTTSNLFATYIETERISGNTATLSGKLTVNDIETIGDVMIGGSLFILGDITLDDIVANTLVLHHDGHIAGNLVVNQDAQVNGKLTANTFQNTGDATIGGNLLILAHLTVDDIVANTLVVHHDALIDGKLTVNGLIDPTGLLLDGQNSAPANVTSSQGLIWIDSSVMPAVLNFNEGGNTHQVLLVGDEANIDHGNLSGLADDDHTQYALLNGRFGGQTLVGGTATGNNLVLVPNSADLATGNIIVNGSIDSFDSTSGALVVAGGVGVSKNVVGGQAVAGGFQAVDGADAGITLPDDRHVVRIDAGTSTMAFAVAVPAQTIEGQVLHVYNNSGQATTGVVTANGGGTTLVCDGTNWYQL